MLLSLTAWQAHGPCRLAQLCDVRRKGGQTRAFKALFSPAHVQPWLIFGERRFFFSVASVGMEHIDLLATIQRRTQFHSLSLSQSKQWDQQWWLCLAYGLSPTSKPHDC